MENSYSVPGEEKKRGIFTPTLIYNEGWMMRIIIDQYKRNEYKSNLQYIKLFEGSNIKNANPRIFSEAQLLPQFYGEPKNETHTSVDGIMGDFNFRTGTRSGIEMKEVVNKLVVIEAKMASGLDEGITNTGKKDYNQAARTVACMINEIINANGNININNLKMNYVVWYPEGNKKIKRQLRDNYLTQEHMVNTIQKRITDYDDEHMKKHGKNGVSEDFIKNWENILNKIEIDSNTWEEILDDMESNKRDRYYGDLCQVKEFYSNCLVYN